MRADLPNASLSRLKNGSALSRKLSSPGTALRTSGEFGSSQRIVAPSQATRPSMLKDVSTFAGGVRADQSNW